MTIRSSPTPRRPSRTALGLLPRASSRPTRTSSRPIPKKADVNQIVLTAVESALFNKVRAQKALSDAVDAANKLIQ